MAIQPRAWLQHALPHVDVPNIRAGYLISAAESAVFIGGNWIFFWTLFMSYSQLGLNDSLAFAFGLFMEIPTGALADVIGKRWTVRAALLLNGIAFLIMGSAEGMAALIGGFLLFQIGLALYSGAAEALQYDSLKERGLEKDWDKVSAAGSSVSFVSLVVAMLLGAPMYALNVRLPHWAWGVAFLVAFAVALRLTEPQVGEQPHFSLRGYFGQLLTGARQLGRPNLRMFVPLMFGLPGVFFIYSWGVVQPAVAVSFGFDANAQSVIASSAYILITIFVRFVPRIRRRLGDLWGLTLLNFGLILALMGMSLPLGTGGILVMLLMHLSGVTSRVWTNVVVNERTPSEIRATTLSTVALLTKLPYVLVAIAAGLMIDAGQLGLFVMGMAAVSSLLLISAHVLRAKTPRISLPVAETLP